MTGELGAQLPWAPYIFNEIKRYHFSSISFQVVVKKPNQKEKQCVCSYHKMDFIKSEEPQSFSNKIRHP